MRAPTCVVIPQDTARKMKHGEAAVGRQSTIGARLAELDGSPSMTHAPGREDSARWRRYPESEVFWEGCDGWRDLSTLGLQQFGEERDPLLHQSLKFERDYPRVKTEQIVHVQRRGHGHVYEPASGDPEAHLV